MTLPIEFDWKEDTVSIVWEDPNCGIIRVHVPGDTDALPKFRGVCFIKIGYKYKFVKWITDTLQRSNLNGQAEFKALVMKDGIRLTKAERRSAGELLRKLGFKVITRRLRDGIVVVKEF